jgi:cytochrome c-type biogenesis protein CcmH
MKGKIRVGIIMCAVLSLLIPAKVTAATESDIARQLICQCGCNMVLLNCSHAECGSRTVMTAFISQQIDQGRSDREITQSFVSQYGEQVLAAPPKRGFNLTAWLLPFAAILFGAIIIYFALKKWTEQRQHQPVNAMIGEDDERYRLQVEEELKQFAGRNFR